MSRGKRLPRGQRISPSDTVTPVLAIDDIRDHDASRRPVVVDVKPAEHAFDRDRFGRGDID